MIGKVIGTYRIVQQLGQQLGQGLHGTVYQAVEQGRGQTVTIKAIQPALAQQAAFKQILRALAATLTSMRHPHLATFHTILQMGNELYVIGEFVNGTPLNEALQRSGVLACEEAVRLAAQILDALSYAHAAGVWHGGIKPSNLLLTADGQIKLIDLGLAQAANALLVQEGLGAAVLNYAAPEQFRGGACDARTDVYALGAVLYEMLTGLPPFRRATDAALRHAHLEETPPSPRNYFPLIPLALEQAVLRALAKPPGARFSSAAEFRQTLLSWANEAQAAASTVAAEMNPPAEVVNSNRVASSSAISLQYEPTPDRFATAAPTPLTPNDWPQLTPQTSAAKASSTSSVASTGLNDEVVVELEEPSSMKRGFWKPIAAVTGVAALLGATYAIVRVNNGDAPAPGPNQIVIKVSPTLRPPSPTPTTITALTEATPVSPVTEKPKIKTHAKQQVAKPPRPAVPALAPKAKRKPAAKVTATLTPTKIAKAKATPTPSAAKKKPTPTPTPVSAKNEQKKRGGVGGFFKGVFGGGGKDKKAEPTPKKAEPTPKPKKVEPTPKPKKT